ncbi:MAG TPA: hypothetical protein VFE72_07440 [Lysobacter sp.]|nr:hypothetical protein [Lysobacter sp.]
MTESQPFKFLLVLANGEKIEGGAESKDLCIDHIRHCLRSARPEEGGTRPVRGYYLGKGGTAAPRQIEA